MILRAKMNRLIYRSLSIVIYYCRLKLINTQLNEQTSLANINKQGGLQYIACFNT